MGAARRKLEALRGGDGGSPRPRIEGEPALEGQSQPLHRSHTLAPHVLLGKGPYYLPHFSDEETGAQTRLSPCPGSHSFQQSWALNIGTWLQGSRVFGQGLRWAPSPGFLALFHNREHSLVLSAFI